MRIGILTLPIRTNYGGILQAYALQTVLERMGHKVVVFDTDNRKSLPLWKMPLSYGKRTLKKMLGQGSVIFLEQKYNKEYPIISQHIQPFIDKYIHRLVVNDLRNLNESDYDAIVVGSDQIWRPKYYRKIKNAFLDFATSWQIKRIAYAASFGTDNWEYTPQQTEHCSKLLKKFDAVSVRESLGVRFCQEHFGVEAQHVLDPTMLLTIDDYIHLADSAVDASYEGNMGCYILDETQQTTQLIEKISNDKQFIPFRINSRVEDKKAPLQDRIQPPVEQCLRGFLESELIVTDSFHVCVFSILFNKPFVVVVNKSRGTARYNSLLSMFGLERCLYSNNWLPQDSCSINWSNVNARLNELRLLSYNFLNQI